MNTKITSLFFFFIALNGFAQSSFSAQQVMELNNGADIFTRTVESSVQNIAVEKQVEFRKRAESLANTKKMEAQKYFEKKYTPADFSEIYSELSQADKVSFSEKTTVFMKEWRNFKAEYQADFKELYNSYQK